MSDPRFARLKTDPRFRRPKRKQHKVVIDDRFKSVFDQAKKNKKAEPRVDKYGRTLPENNEEENLKRYYRLATGSDEEQNEKPKTVDYARGEFLMESSDEEEDDKRQRDDDEVDVNFGSSDEEEIIKIGGDSDEIEIDLNEDRYAELDAQVAAYAEINKDSVLTKDKEDVGIVDRTRRLAVVNLDWDHVQASHLHKIFSSLVSLTAPNAPVSVASAAVKSSDSKKTKGGAAPVAKGTVLSVRVYPSEFGRARMEREEREGPPPEVFKKKRNEDEEINERTVYEFGDEDDYDEDALRRYQLERLRYYYAIVDCDTVEAASHIYNELEGTELERSANVFDLSFVPDDMTFDVELRDEATEDLSTNYKPVDYVTDALRHSKVKLTWDEDDPERFQVTRRHLTRQEIEEADFNAYIASSSEEDEGDENVKSGADKSKSNKDASRQKLRALLLGGNDDELPEGWNDDGGGSDIDMEITFTPGLSESKNEEGETTLDKYQRKIREKRKKKKEELKEKVKAGGKKKVSGEGKDEGGGDEFFDFGGDNEDESGEEQRRDVKKANKRRERGSKLKERSGTPPLRKESTVEELALIAASDNANGLEPKHFDMKAVLKAEKRKGKKSKKDKKDLDEDEVQEDFKIDVNDERFKILHEDHHFAIDPTNPHFKKTKGMKALLEERQRRQRTTRVESANGSSRSLANDGQKSLKSLVDSVKRKSEEGHSSRKRKRF